MNEAVLGLDDLLDKPDLPKLMGFVATGREYSSRLNVCFSDRPPMSEDGTQHIAYNLLKNFA
ncbi:hypothetical protein [Phormidium tenue]|uniref:hypothetical protein n=1 Tax=Phormidium tenue TaxID=126344 RepID=UPI0030DCA1C6